MAIETINPHNGEILQRYPCLSQEQIQQKLIKAEQARQAWAQLPLSARCEPMAKMAELLRAQATVLASLTTQEMGKPISQALTEINKCAWLCEHYIDNIEEYLAAENIETDKRRSYISYQPLGIIFAIMPWNFPFWQVFRFAVPNLLAGNAGVLKHAPISTGTGLKIEQLFREAGFPEHLFQTFVMEVEDCETVIAHPLVHGVTLTGSCRAGRAVASLAGKHLKKCVLELGGSDPYLILDDADLDLAANQCARSRFNNAGQICISAKRIILVESIHDNFVERFIEEAKQFTLGDPNHEATQMGPMARLDLRENLERQVKSTITEGATCLLGGQALDGPGFYYPATVLDRVGEKSTATQEEIFGPVACLYTVKSEQEAIDFANQTEYGLSAAVFTQDLERGEIIARDQLQAGTCSLNGLVGSDPRLPFGGIKNSGYGRELGSFGAHEFTNIKTLLLN
jgi:succinate-semialdehyde dehydrogenase/glutarate-semialdehyde dehydrogenase